MKKLITLIAILSSFTFAQYNSNSTDNTVVMWGKYKWTNMSEVDGGSAADRNQAVNTWYSRTNQANKLLKSSMFLYHYWTGAVEDVHIVNEYASVEDATEAIRTAGKIRQIAFSDQEERRAAWNHQSKYFENYHEDLHIFENHVALEKKRIGGFGDSTIVTVTVGYFQPMGLVENGSAEERYKLLQKFQKEVIANNPKIVSQKILTHLWSGKVVDGYFPVITISEYNSMEDADNAGDDNPALFEKAFSEEEGAAYVKILVAFGAPAPSSFFWTGILVGFLLGKPLGTGI